MSSPLKRSERVIDIIHHEEMASQRRVRQHERNARTERRGEDRVEEPAGPRTLTRTHALPGDRQDSLEHSTEGQGERDEGGEKCAANATCQHTHTYRERVGEFKDGGGGVNAGQTFRPHARGGRASETKQKQRR